VSYRVTVRRGPKVERERQPTLDAALGALAHHAAGAPRREAVDVLSRRYAAREQVATRVELKGPEGRGGVDVRGDGTMVAWTGGLRRAVVEPRPGEDAAAALRRALTA
jgi:hypothetical protein